MARHAGQPGRAEQPAGHVCRGLGSDVEGPRGHVQATPGHSDGGEVADGFVRDCKMFFFTIRFPRKMVKCPFLTYFGFLTKTLRYKKIFVFIVLPPCLRNIIV